LLVEEKGVRQKILGGFEKQVEKKPIIFFTKKVSFIGGRTVSTISGTS
jgi:hypothetical protein